jgi:hypothetical protein
MKKILSIWIIATMVAMVGTCSIGLCFGATQPSATVSVLATLTDASFTVSEKVQVQSYTYNKAATVSNLTVKNLSSTKSLTVENIRAVGSGDWTAVSSATIDTAAKDSKYINLSMDGNDLTTTAGYDLSNGTIAASGEKDFALTGRISAQTGALNATEVAKLIVTLVVK